MASKSETAILDERLRISAILESPEGLRNPGVARELAFRANLPVASALELLRTVPGENPYLQAMSREAIGIGAPTTLTGLHDPKAARLAEIKESMRAFNETKGYTRRIEG